MIRLFVPQARLFLTTTACILQLLSPIVLIDPLFAQTTLPQQPAASLQQPIEDEAEPPEGYWPNDFDADAFLRQRSNSRTLNSQQADNRQSSTVDAPDNPDNPDNPVRSAAVAAPNVTGRWSTVMDWPVVAIHASLLPNGKVIAWDATPDDFDGDPHTNGSNSTRATVWDPVTNSHTNVNPNTESDLFCSGHSLLADGRLFVAGGDVGANDAIDKTNIFNPMDNAWTRVGNMSYPRWYPSVTELPSGDMLVTAGGPSHHEVWSTSGTYRTLTGAVRTLPTYPWLQVAANGTVFMVGPNPPMAYLDTTGSGSWQNAGNRDSIWRGYGSHAMYDVDKILVTGGGPSTKSSLIVNPNTAAVSNTAPMRYGRRQHNLTVLADGTVLAIGGNSSGATLVDLNASVMPAELWDPATGQWTTMDSLQVTRQYHSTALLLPDGRVLSAGGGYCGDCNAVGYFEPNAEIFSPPYLFKLDGSGQLADRPSISTAPGQVGYGESFVVNSPHAAGIAKVSLIRPGSVTHSVDGSQRYIPLAFTISAGQLTVVAPASANVAPPGYYMLVLVDSDGVPSVAEFVQVGTDDSPPPPPPPGEDGSMITIRARGNEGPENVELHINGQLMRSWVSIGTAYTDFSYQHDSYLTTEQIEVHFTNDRFDSANGIDYNLFVDKITVDDTVYQTEDPSVLGKGFWNGTTCALLAAHQVERLSCNGFFRYAINNTPPPTNNPPVFADPEPQINTVNDVVNLAVSATDPDGDTLAYSAIGLPTGLTIDRDTGLIAGALTQVGIFNVTLAVNDGVGDSAGSDSTSFVWTVNALANNPPIIMPIDAQTNIVGDTVALMAVATDADGDAITFSATGLPAGLSIAAGSGQIAGTLTAAGSYNVRVTASDGTGDSNGTDSTSFVWTVSDDVASTCSGLEREAEEGALSGDMEIGVDGADSGGQYLHMPDGSGSKGFGVAHSATYCFTVTDQDVYRIQGRVYAADGTSDSFFVSVDGAPATGYLWDIARGGSYTLDVVSDRNGLDPVEIILSPGEHTVVIHAREDGARLDTLSLIPLNSQNVNQPPTLGTLGNQSSMEGDIISLFIPASDAENDPLTFGAVGLPAGLSMVAGTGEIKGTLLTGSRGIYNVTVSVDDGSNSRSGSFVWSVSSVMANCGSLLQEAEDGLLNGGFAVVADPDANGGAYMTSVNVGSTGTFGSTTYAEYCFTAPAAGDYILETRFKAFDHISDSFFITVDGLPTTGHRWNLWPADGTFVNGNVTDGRVANPLVLSLLEGDHILRVYLREKGAILDSFEVVPVVNAAALSVSELVREEFERYMLLNDSAEEASLLEDGGSESGQGDGQEAENNSDDGWPVNIYMPIVAE